MDKLLAFGGVVLAGAAFAAHEYLVRRSTRDGRPRAAARRLILLLLLAALVVVTAAARIPERLERMLSAASGSPIPFDETGDPLLRDALSTQRPVRPFPASGSREDVEAWRAYIVEALRARIGVESFPATVPIDVVSTDEVDGVRRTLVRFESFDGTRIPVFVHQPLAGGMAAGILVVPGHGRGIAATAGLLPPDYQHQAALELARLGYVTLTPELRGFGMLAPDGVPTHRAVAFAALEAGTFYKAIVVRDLARALTVLEHWPGVDRSKLAVAGTSLGAETAVLLATLDPRAAIVISHSYGGHAGPRSVPAQIHDAIKQTPHGCHTIPGINTLLLDEDWFRLLAPRPLLVVRGEGDLSGTSAEFAQAVSGAYATLGAADRFTFSIEPGGHEFFLAPTRQFLVRWWQ